MIVKILVTGGAGYKGVILTEKLLDKGHKVTVLDNFMYGYDSLLHLISHDNLVIVKEDVRNGLNKHVKDQDVIFHLAGISGYPACEANPHSAQIINVDATRKLVSMLSKDQWIFYASTTSFYGDSGSVCDEDSRIKPVSLYGKTKYEAEKIVMQKENAIGLRFATIFGISPKMRVDLLVNDFAYRAVNDRCIVLFKAASKRTFLHVQDAIGGYLLALENFPEMKNDVYNVGDERLNYSKLEISETIKKHVDCSIIDSEIEDLDIRDFIISYDKIKTFGFSATYSLEEGVRELVKLYGFYKPFSTFKTI